MRIRLAQLLLLWAAAVLLAFIAATASIGAIAKQAAPAPALGLSPANGWPLAMIADRATRTNAIAVDTHAGRPVHPEIVEIARRAYSSEPALAAPLRTLALHYQSQGEGDRAARMMQLASQITKRDFIVNYSLIDAYSRAGRADEAMAVYDQMLRVLGDRNGSILTMMAASLADPSSIGPVHRLLSQRPPWADSFWHVVAQVPSALENGATLRILQARNGVDVPREKDVMLLGSLAQARHFDVGRRLYEVIGRRGATSRQAPVNNGDFSAPTDFPPFNWLLTSSGELGAAIDPGSGMLEISALGGSRGEVARQVVQLSAGRYDVQASWRSGSSDNTGGLRVELACADRDLPTAVRTIRLPPGRSVRAVDLTGEACTNYWLVVAAEAPAGSPGFDALVDRIQLVRR